MAQLIAITGKGGVGKSSLAALMIRDLLKHDKGPILALDADPDANLATLLGIDVETTIGDLREEVLQQIKNFPAGMSKQSYIESGLHQLIVENGPLDLITMGRGEGPGCYCYINNLLRKFANDLMPAYQWVVMDNEAGMEHLSRRTAAWVDHLICVVNENPLSMDCARRIDQLVSDMGRDIRKRYYLLNAVREDRADAVKEKLSDLKLEYLGAIPRDERLEETIFQGQPVTALDNSPAVTMIAEVMEKIGAN